MLDTVLQLLGDESWDLLRLRTAVLRAHPRSCKREWAHLLTQWEEAGIVIVENGTIRKG